ncbi:MAG: hypothetical protein QW360_01040, partial [Thermofilum sp.]
GLADKARRLVGLLAERCGTGLVVAVGGYWGLMRVVVNEALGEGPGCPYFPATRAGGREFPRGSHSCKDWHGF